MVYMERKHGQTDRHPYSTSFSSCSSSSARALMICRSVTEKAGKADNQVLKTEHTDVETFFPVGVCVCVYVFMSSHLVKHSKYTYLIDSVDSHSDELVVLVIGIGQTQQLVEVPLVV